MSYSCFPKRTTRDFPLLVQDPIEILDRNTLGLAEGHWLSSHAQTPETQTLRETHGHFASIRSCSFGRWSLQGLRGTAAVDGLMVGSSGVRAAPKRELFLQELARAHLPGTQPFVEILS